MSLHHSVDHARVRSRYHATLPRTRVAIHAPTRELRQPCQCSYRALYHVPTHEHTIPQTQAALPTSHRAVDNAAKAEDAEAGEHAEAREVGRHHGGDLLVDHGRDEEPQAHLQAGEKATRGANEEEEEEEEEESLIKDTAGEHARTPCTQPRSRKRHAHTPQMQEGNAGVAFEPDLSTKP